MTKIVRSLCLAPPRPDSLVSSICVFHLHIVHLVPMGLLNNVTLHLECCFVVTVGEALLESCTAVDFVYCSPSLRCVQTAQHILQGRTTSSLTLSKSPRNIWLQLLLVPSLMRNSCRIFHICYDHEIPMDYCASEILMSYFKASGQV